MEFGIGEGAGLPFFAFPDDGRVVSRGGVIRPLIHTVGGDVELAIYAPARPLYAIRQIYDGGVRPLELDAQKLDDSLGEPCHVFGGAALEVFEGGQPVLAHEAEEVASVGVGGRGLPHKRAAEVEWVVHGGKVGKDDLQVRHSGQTK